MGEQSKKWYVVKAISGKEKKAKEYIENEVAHSGLSEFVSRVLIPTEKVFSVRNGKRVSKDRTLFPGYVLIEASLEGEVAHVIKNVPNVIDFLSEKDGKPVPLQDFEVKRILGRVDEMMDNDEELLEPFIVGETVKIIDGPFNNFSGVIDEINLDKKKLTVTVKIFSSLSASVISNEKCSYPPICVPSTTPFKATSAIWCLRITFAFILIGPATADCLWECCVLWSELHSQVGASG